MKLGRSASAKVVVSTLHLHLLALLLLLTVCVPPTRCGPWPWESAVNDKNSPTLLVDVEDSGELRQDADASVDVNGDEDEASPGYADALTKAFCKARCMVGESIPRLDPVSLFLTTPSTCESQECVECEQCMLGVGQSSDCASKHGLPIFCIELYLRDQQHVAGSGTSFTATSTSTRSASDLMRFSDLPSPSPLFHCSQKQSDNVTFNAAFRFEYSTTGATNSTLINSSSNHHAQMLTDFASWSPELVPRLFVVRQEFAGTKRVDFIISDKWLHTVKVAESTRLSISVTAVSATTIYRPSPPTTITLKDSVHRASGSPKNLRVVDIRLVPSPASAGTATTGTPGNGRTNGGASVYVDADDLDYHHDDKPTVVDAVLAKMDLEVVLHWESGSGLDATCIYGTYCLHDEMTKKESKTPEHAFWAVLDKKLMLSYAQFGAKFKVDVVERPERGREENSSSINIVIPTCLDFLQGDFTKCAPPTVSNLRGLLQQDGFFTLDWDPPEYHPHENATISKSRSRSEASSNNNNVQTYKIEIHRLPHVLMMSSTYFLVPGNTTHFEKQLNLSSAVSLTAGLPGTAGLGTGSSGSSAADPAPESILVVVQAKTLGGTSNPSQLTVRAETVQASSLVEKSLTTIGLIFALILLVVIFFVIKNSFQKHQRKKSNREYFETLSLNGGEIPRVDDLDDGRNGALIQDTTFLHGYEFTKWEIPTNRMIVKGVIGSGAFGIVREGILFEHGKKRTVAVKTPKSTNGISGETETMKFWEEFEILKGLGKHVHIVGLIGILASKAYEPPSLVVEYCQGGDLQSHLRKHCKYRPLPLNTDTDNDNDLTDELNTNTNTESTDDGGGTTDTTTTTTDTVVAVADGEQVVKKLSKPSVFLVTNETYFMKPEDKEQKTTYYLTDLDIISYARQIACGMEFLATNKIVHRDLAARNVLVSIEHDRGSEQHGGLPKRTLKISDFGLSRDVYEQNWYKRNSKGLVPVKWLALECLLQEMYTSKSDVWSFGILLWEIVTLGGSPYPGVDNADMFERLKKGYRMQQPSYCPDALYELMIRCWDEDPSRRPDFSRLKTDLDKMMEASTVLNYLYLDPSGRMSASSSTLTGETTAGAAAAEESISSTNIDESTNTSNTTTTTTSAGSASASVKVNGNGDSNNE